MHPEVRHNQMIREYRKKEAIDLSDHGPLGLEYTQLRKGILKRASWVLDFKRKHTRFSVGYLGDSEQETYLPNTGIVFHHEEGKKHLKEWNSFKKPHVRRSAKDMAAYGYYHLGVILKGLEYRVEDDKTYYPEIDKKDPFKKYPKSTLNKLAEDKTFKRILSLIKYTADLEDYKNENELYATFAAVVGFAHAYAGKIPKEEKRVSENKKVLRNLLIDFAVAKYDRGLGGYLQELQS